MYVSREATVAHPKVMPVMLGNEYWVNHFDGIVPVRPVLDVKVRDNVFNELVVAAGKPQRSDGRESVNEFEPRFTVILVMVDALVKANRSLGIVPVRLLLLRLRSMVLVAVEVSRPEGMDPLN